MKHMFYEIRKGYWEVNVYVDIGAGDGVIHGGIRVGLTKTRIYKEAL